MCGEGGRRDAAGGRGRGGHWHRGETEEKGGGSEGWERGAGAGKGSVTPASVLLESTLGCAHSRRCRFVHTCVQERPYPKAPCDMTTYPSSYRTQSTSQQQQQQQPSMRSAGTRRGAAPAAAGAGAAGGLGGSLGGLEGGFGLGNGGLDRRKRPRGSVGSLGYGGCGEGGQGYQGEGEGQGRAFAAACEAEVQRRFRQAFGGGELGGRWRAST